jgi:dihydropyrimidinase
VSGKRTLVAGGAVATDYGMFPADVLIEDERIVSVADWGALNGGDEVIDATGSVVIPSAIDPHAHFEEGCLHRV